MKVLFAALLGLLPALSIADGPTFIELPGPEYSEVMAVAVVKLPPLDKHERAMLGCLVRAIPKGPAEYSPGDILALTGGQAVRCDLMTDHLVIEVPTFREDLAGAVTVLSELLSNARMDDSPPSAANEGQDPWESLLRGPLVSPDGIKLRRGELEEFYHRLFRPETVTVAISGPFAPAEAQAMWERRIKSWQGTKLLRGWPAPDPLPSAPPVIDGLELDGAEIVASSPDVAPDMLALFALGCGKGASLHRLAREEDGLSYRQEAMLWPSLNGWIPRLVVASTDLQDGQAAGVKLRKQLLDDIDSWTEADRLRAAGLAEGVLVRGVPMSPLYFHADRPVDGSPRDRAFLEAYWFSKTGQHWRPVALANGLKTISLEALKAAARQIVEHSEVLVRKAK